MGRTEDLQYAAVSVARLSTCSNQHGSLVTKGNRIKALGCNSALRTSFLGRLDVCMHAEMASVTYFMNTVARKYPLHKLARKLKELTVWSVRISNNGLGNAMPCKTCVTRLQSLGFGWVAYSDEKGEIQFRRLSQCSNTHVSAAQKKLSKHTRL